MQTREQAMAKVRDMLDRVPQTVMDEVVLILDNNYGSIRQELERADDDYELPRVLLFAGLLTAARGQDPQERAHQRLARYLAPKL